MTSPEVPRRSFLHISSWSFKWRMALIAALAIAFAVGIGWMSLFPYSPEGMDDEWASRFWLLLFAGLAAVFAGLKEFAGIAASERRRSVGSDVTLAPGEAKAVWWDELTSASSLYAWLFGLGALVSSWTALA